jgi:hypothetical protein
MAKPLGPKSILIRDAIKNNPDLGNTEIAQLINGSDERKKDKIEVKPGDIAAQRQAMKKAGVAVVPAVAAEADRAEEPAGKGRVDKKRPGRRPSRKPGRQPTAASAVPPAPTATTDVFTHMEAIKEAVRTLGADQVRRIVGLFEDD